MSDTVLVTGGSGFVGSRVMEALIRSGTTPISLDRRPNPDPKIQNIQGDITDPSSFDLQSGPKTVVHCAGVLESSNAGAEVLYKVNLEGTKIVYRKAVEAGVRRFVFMSTIMAVGPRGKDNDPITEKTDPLPDEPYGRSKLSAERFLLERGELDDVEVFILRPPVIYGEGMSEHSSAMRTFVSVRKGIMPLVDGGRHHFNMLYIGNLASAIVLASIDRGARTGVYNVNEGPYILRQVISAISTEMGVKKGYFRIPRPFFYVASRLSEAISPLLKGPPPLSMTKYRALTSDVWAMDAWKIRRELGFAPPFTLKEGIGRTCQHYGWSYRNDSHSSP